MPSFLSFAVVNLLEKHFGRLVDYDFTARMEDDLDRIARGEAQSVPWLRRFYFGEGDGATGGAADAGNGDGDHLGGLKELVTDLGAIDAREVSSFPVGNDIMLRVGRYGPYIERGEKDSENHQRADVPEDLAPDELTVELRRGAARQAERRLRAGRRPGDRATRSSPRTAATARTSPRCSPRAPRRPARTRSSRAPPRCSSRCRSTRSRSRTRSS